MSLPRSFGPALGHLHQRRIALELRIGSQPRLFRGWSTFHSASGLGPALHIAIDGPGEPLEIILQERHWRGRIECDERFGCHYYLQGE